MGDASRVGEARRHAAALSAELGFGDVEAGRLALVVTELGTNLVKHARAGRLLIATRRHGEAAEVEVLSVDEGPGIDNLEQCMGDGFSTGGSPGTGLGALRRLADSFDIHSRAPGGTLVVARVRASSKADPAQGAFRVGVVALCCPGEKVCGDGWAFASSGQQASLMMADGLGHGPDAEEAAEAALRQFRKSPFSPLGTLMEDCHAVMRATRGAAVAAAQLDAGSSKIRSAGAGNVIMRIASGTSDKTLLSQHGTLGVQMRRPEEFTTDWPRHAVLAVHSDGVMARWPSQALAGLLGHDPSLAAALLVRDFCRGKDDATAMVIRRKE